MRACSAEWQERLSAGLDGEVDAREQRALEAHLQKCAGCVSELRGYEALRAALAPQAVVDTHVPADLRARVTRLAAAGPRPSVPRRRLLGGVVAAVASLGLLWGTWPGGMNQALAMDLERHHLKAFSRVSPCEFDSSDPAAVEAWVAREVGYAISVPTLPGATLLGARRCRLHGQLSASLLYRVGDRALTLFLPPPGSSASKDAAAFAEEGATCAKGPVGERICVATRGDARAAIIVSELEETVLLDALTHLAP